MTVAQLNCRIPHVRLSEPFPEFEWKICGYSATIAVPSASCRSAASIIDALLENQMLTDAESIFERERNLHSGVELTGLDRTKSEDDSILVLNIPLTL